MGSRFRLQLISLNLAPIYSMLLPHANKPRSEPHHEFCPRRMRLPLCRIGPPWLGQFLTRYHRFKRRALLLQNRVVISPHECFVLLQHRQIGLATLRSCSIAGRGSAMTPLNLTSFFLLALLQCLDFFSGGSLLLRLFSLLKFPARFLDCICAYSRINL